MKVLISGAGIAGPCLAYWLQRQGIQTTLVERSAQLRTGGYVVDFWGAGFDVAERMGLVPQLLEKGYKVKEVRAVDRNGKRVSGFAADVIDRLMRGRATSLPRGELAASIYAALGDRVETIFGDSITALEENGHEVRVQFERSPPRAFDLVIGADGLHSQVRRLAFGEQTQFEKYLGFKVAAFAASGYRPREELVYMTYTQLGQQISRFSMRDDQTMFLFIFADGNPDIPRDLAAQKALLRERFSGSGWESPNILAALDQSEGLYFDRVSQIRIERWSKGRVALVGDAAFCASLLAGQGSALAMVAAYLLAGELKRARGNHEIAFARYHQQLGEFIAKKQQVAVRFAGFFAPASRFELFLRNQVMKLMVLPLVSELAIGRELRDTIELPEY